MQYQVIISTITIRIQRLSTNDWIQTAWAADLYTLPGEAGETQV